MSGYFDGPPDSETDRETADRIVRAILNGTQTPEDISPSGELYRYIGRFHRMRTATNPAEHVGSHMASGQESRRVSQPDEQESSPLFVLPPQPSAEQSVPAAEQIIREREQELRRPRIPRIHSSAQAWPSRSRPGRYGLRSDRNFERNRNAVGENASSSALADLRQLDQQNSNLRALLDDPVPELSTPAIQPQTYSGEQGRRSKRRKLDADRLDSGFRGFKYGRYGQAEPGKLKMEIVSCDGGIFDNQAGNFAAENVLRNDTSVYCTKSNRCNLVLRHQGATVFCLSELVIKAPHDGYTAPVQEGMIFVSMTSDDLLTRTAQYQIQYSPAKPRRSVSRPNDLPRIMSIRHSDDTPMTTAQMRARRLYDIGVQDEECEYRTAQIPSDFTESASIFQVTVEGSDSEDNSSAGLSRHARSRRMMGLRFEESESSDDDDGERERPSAWQEHYPFGTSSRVGPPLERRQAASNITLSEAVEASQIATQEAVRAVGGGLMAPHAKFFIERDKSKCTVKFDPPVSGRFILLKMWSPHHDASSNIDIQSVVAKGFAGPRFFPAVEMR